MSPASEYAQPAVLARYGAAVEGLRWAALGSGGGFSGATIWRGDDPAGTPVLALKAWPPGTTADRLAAVHGWMRQVAHLPFVPAVLPARDGSTVVAEAGRVWDLTRWLPGTADFHAHPNRDRLANACTAVAQLHRAWERGPAFAPCPAVHRRLRALADWQAHRPRFAAQNPDDTIRRGVAEVERHAGAAEAALRPWAARPVAVQPCLCDVWHDHVLFTGDAVTGVIDYGAMKIDHVAVDLARLLGSLVGTDDAAFAAGLTAYRAAGGVEVSPEFVRLLDRTGLVCGVIGWLLRLTATAPDPRAVARLRQLVDRLAALPPAGVVA